MMRATNGTAAVSNGDHAKNARRSTLLATMNLPIVGASAAKFEADVGYDHRQVRSWTQWITPGLADEWLKTSQLRNRKERRRKIETIARDIKNGRFTYTGVPLLFDEDGNIIDGHHRLHALASFKGSKDEQKVGLWVDVKWGLPAKEVQSRIDGHAARSPGDKLNLKRSVEYAHAAASISLLLWQCTRWEKSPGWSEPSFDELDQIFVRYRDEIDWVNRTIGGKIEPGISSGGSPILAAFAFARKIDPARLEDLALAYKTGEFNGDPGHSMRRLRHLVSSQRNDHSAIRLRTGRWRLMIMALVYLEQELTGERKQKLVEKDPLLDVDVIKRLVEMRTAKN